MDELKNYEEIRLYDDYSDIARKASIVQKAVKDTVGHGLDINTAVLCVVLTENVSKSVSKLKDILQDTFCY